MTVGLLFPLRLHVRVHHGSRGRHGFALSPFMQQVMGMRDGTLGLTGRAGMIMHASCRGMCLSNAYKASSLAVKKSSQYFVSPSSSLQHLGNRIAIPTTMLTKPIITTPYTAHGISIERTDWRETSISATGAPVSIRSILISAGQDVIMEVTEVLVDIKGSAGRHLIHEAVLAQRMAGGPSD